MTTLNLGTFGMNHIDDVNLLDLFKINDYKLQEIIVNNESVKSWLNNQYATNIPDEIKSKINVAD